MCDLLAIAAPGLLAATSLKDIFSAAWPIVLIFLGFSAVIFVHELGHFAVAKWCGVRVEKFAIGFLREVVGFTRGETRYSLNILPLGGYVKMLGQEDFDIDKSGELVVKDDPRSFTHKPVGQRMMIVSAGVVMNMIFAALIFMLVFMVGKKGLSTEVGYVRPNWPADHAGFEPGDVIERIDGTRINEFSELNMAILLADPLEPLNFEVRRGGEIRHLRLTPHNNEDEGILQIGVGPAVTRVVGALGPTFDPKRDDHLQPEDVVVELNGQAVTDENANLMMYRLMSAPAEITDLAVERSDGKGGTRRVKINLPIQFGIYPADPADRDGVRAHVLGLTPLVKVASVDPDSRAFFAGMKAGDIVVRWDDRMYPTQDYINSSVLKHPEVDIPIVVERAGKRVSLTVRPKAKMRFGRPTGPAQIGADVNLPATELLRVGAVTDSTDGKPTPAAQAGIPEGALITHVNQQPVTTWLELIDRLRGAAGGAVTLTYNHENETGLTCRFEVPHCVRTLLKLPPHAQITAIDNQESVNIELNGMQRSVTVSRPFGLREILKEKIGKTVTVTYTPNAFEGPRTAELPVTADMVDPWLGRIMYYVDVRPLQATKVVKAEGPIDAIAIGIRKTVYFIANVYATMNRMIFSRSVGVENLSGPVGIVKIGRDVARVGFIELLYFLAMISANLAVINFLPLPIVDGGLMVFLLIEKIKGSPVNLKVQMATQVIGLILIGAAFIFVTIQDLTR